MRCYSNLLTCLLLATAACGPTVNSRTLSAQDPHPTQAGPWFEGWYARVTDLGGGRSMATIVGSFRPAGKAADDTTDDGGYIGLLYNDGLGGPTRSWTFFPDKTRIRVNGAVTQQAPDLFDPNDQPFTWEADGYGSFSNDKVSVNVPGQVEWTMDFSGGRAWDEGLPLGPESYLALAPVPLHWYVKSLNAPASYSLKIYESDGTTSEITGNGHAHLEKNWGQAFPKAWNWLQADDISGDAQVVLGGGTVQLAEVAGTPIDLTAWIGGYRSANEQWDIRFSDPGTQIHVDQGTCQGPFHLHAQRLDLEVDIVAAAPVNTFGPVAVPTPTGFIRDFGAESFGAQVTVKTYRPAWTGMHLTEERVFRSAALEFGAASYHPHCQR